MDYTEEELNDAKSGRFCVDREPIRHRLGWVIAECQYDKSDSGKRKVINEQFIDDSNWSKVDDIVKGCIDRLFEEGRFEDTMISKCYQYGHESIEYRFEELVNHRKRMEYLAQREKERQEAMDRYNAAIQWARDHGAELRKGKVSKDLAKFRIYKAGLMEEFNKEWPMYAFTYEDVKIASKRLIERDIEFSRKPKKPYKDPEQAIRDKYTLE